MNKESCGTYTMDYFSDIKKNTFESVLMRWMELEPIIQSEQKTPRNTHRVWAGLKQNLIQNSLYSMSKKS